MENLNNVPSSGTYGGAINEVNHNFSLVKGAIDGLEGRTIRSKGLFPTLAALNAAYPSPIVGDYAYVGSGLPAEIYDCVTAGTWHDTGQTGGSETINLGDYSTTTQMNAAIDSGLQGQVGYAVCSTAGGTARKDVVVSGFKLLANGGALHIKMTTANTNASATMNISPTSTVIAANTKPLFYNGTQATAENTWEANEILSIYYDGTNYQATNSQGGGGKAEKIKYNNSQSGLASDNVKGALDDIAENLFGETEISLSGYSNIGYAISSSTKKWTSNANTQKHILVPIAQGSKYIIEPNVTLGTVDIAWLTSASCVSGALAPLVEGTGVSIIRTRNVLIAPATATYLYIRTVWDSVQYRPAYFGIKTSIKNELEEETTFSSGEKVSSKGIDNELNGRSNNLPTSKAVFDEIKAVMSLESIDLTSSLNTDLKNCWFGSATFTSGGKHKVIPVYGNYESITITGCATENRGSYYTFAKSYSTPSAGDSIDFCEGISRLKVDANVTETIPIPSDCNYILIGIINARNNSYVPKALSVEAYIATPPSNKKVEKAFKPYANSAAWNAGSSWAVTTSPTYEITGGFIYKISAENCQVKIDARTGVACYYSFLKSFTEPKNGDVVDWIGEHGRETVAAGASTGWIDVPSECNYVWIGIANANGTIYTPELVSIRYDVVDYVNGAINAVRDIAPYSYIGNSLDLRDFSLRKGFSTKVIKPNTNIGVWGNNEDLAQQSLAIYNDFIFLFYHGGYCNVLDTNTCELLYSFQMNSDISSENNHCGNACFSEKFFASDDEFPLLYLSNHLNGGECYVLRIQRDDDGGFSTSSITLVQKINNAEGSAHNVAHFYPHKDKLICHSGTWYGIWNLPDINTETVETISIHSDDILEEFSTPISEHTAAGQVARNGRIFCLWYRDRGTSPRYDLLTIYNFVTNEYDAKIYLPGRLAALEFEGLDIYDGKIYIGYNKNNQIGIIEFD